MNEPRGRAGRSAWLKLALLVLLVGGAAWSIRRFGLVPPDANASGSFDGADLRAWVAGFGAWGPVLYVLLYAIGPVLFFPGSVLTLGAGAIFGTGWGFLIVAIGSNLSANLAFLLARLLGREAVGRLLAGSMRLKTFDEGAARHGFRLIFFLRLIPAVPFIALNYGAGLSPVRWRDYFLGTLLGMLPGIFAYTFLGGAILDRPWNELLMNERFWIALAVFALVAAIPWVHKKLTAGNRTARST